MEKSTYRPHYTLYRCFGCKPANKTPCYCLMESVFEPVNCIGEQGGSAPWESVPLGVRKAILEAEDYGF